MAVVWHIRLPSGPDLPHCRGERHGGGFGCLRGGEEGGTGEELEMIFSRYLLIVWIWPLLLCEGKLHCTVFYVHSRGYTILPRVSVLQYCTVSENQEQCTCCLNKPSFTLQACANPSLFDFAKRLISFRAYCSLRLLSRFCPTHHSERMSGTAVLLPAKWGSLAHYTFLYLLFILSHWVYLIQSKTIQ